MVDNLEGTVVEKKKEPERKRSLLEETFRTRPSPISQPVVDASKRVGREVIVRAGGLGKALTKKHSGYIPKTAVIKGRRPHPFEVMKKQRKKYLR